jgi:hypothetical protein
MIVGSAYVDLRGSCATVDMGGQLTYHRKLGGTDEEICEFYFEQNTS